MLKQSKKQNLILKQGIDIMINNQLYIKFKDENKRTMKFFTLIIISLFCSTSLQAQQAIVVLGNDVIGNNGSVSYSIGQITYNIYKKDNASISEGIQQPYEISEITIINEIQKNTISIYPNPTTDELILNLYDFDLNNIAYYLYDLNGKLLLNNKIINYETKISMIAFIPAIYILKIVQNNHELKIFKIIKK